MFPSLHINPGLEAEATGMNTIIHQFEIGRFSWLTSLSSSCRRNQCPDTQAQQ